MNIYTGKSTGWVNGCGGGGGVLYSPISTHEQYNAIDMYI